MAMNGVQLTSLRLLKSASAGAVDDTVSAPVWYRGKVLPGAVQGALAARVPLPALQWQAALALPARRPRVLPVSLVSSSDDPYQRHAVRGEQGPVDDVVDQPSAVEKRFWPCTC